MKEMNLDDEYYIEVPNELPDNEAVSAYAIMVYIILLSLKTMYGYGFTTIKQIGEILHVKRLDKYSQTIKRSIKELIDLELIEIFSIEQKSIHVREITNTSGFYISFKKFDECYFKVFINDVHQIIREYEHYSIKELPSFFRYYLVIQRWTNFQDNIAGRHVANSKVKHIVTDNRTIQKYNNTLQEMQIFWYENGYRSSRDNRVISTRFARCRVISQEDFQNEIAKWAAQNDYVSYDKLAANEKRRVTQLTKWDKKRTQQEQLNRQREREIEAGKVVSSLEELGDDYLEILIEEIRPIGIVTSHDIRRIIVENQIVLTGNVKEDATSKLRALVMNTAIGF